MSVVAQQISTIEKAKAQRALKILFQETTLKLDPTCAVFVTMNPDYYPGKYEGIKEDRTGWRVCHKGFERK